MIYEVKISLKDGTLLFMIYEQSSSNKLEAMIDALVKFNSQYSIDVAEDELVISAKIINQSKSK